MQRLLKRIAALMLILLLLFSFSACSDQTGNTDARPAGQNHYRTVYQ